jgi:hemerythrin superfamily protein
MSRTNIRLRPGYPYRTVATGLWLPDCGYPTVAGETCGGDVTSSQSERDVTDILISDHRDVTALIGEIWAVADPMIRRDLTDTAISELVRHAVAEEMYVYPAMRKYLTDGEKAVEHDVEEHKELERVMKALESVDVSSAEFETSLRQLETILADHVQDEESEQFPELRRRVPHEELVELAGKVEKAKKLAPTRPHPGAPNNELFHKLVGPGVGLVDRLRDKLTGRATR